MSTTERMKLRREEAKRQGICTSCFREPAMGDICPCLCETCRTKRLDRRRASIESKKTNRLCIECGEPSLPSKNYCLRHFDIAKERHKNRRTRLIRENRCTICSQPASVSQRCETCILKSAANELWGEVGRWVDLKKLYDEQSGLCCYFGEPITIGVDASVDHKIPKCRGGTNELSNLQWVSNYANVMKWTKTHEEFVAAVLKLAVRFKESHNAQA